MKKLFTLICALVGLTSSVNAATIDDVKQCKHSYVLVADEWTNNGTVRPGKGNLFGDGFFLDVTGGSVATNKGNSDPGEILKDETGAPTGELRYDAAFAEKYGEYGAHYNSLRLKKAQDVIAMKVTAGSKLIFLIQGNNKSGTSARIPCIATDAKLTKPLNEKPGADFPAVPAGFLYEWTAKDDYTIYIGSYNGDMFVGYIIVEANEAPGTPSVKVGDQTFENGLWYREVICKPNTYELWGEKFNTVVTYTTDGTTPTADSPKYTEPIKCYKEQTLKFQAFVDYGDGNPADICEGADNDGIVSFSFNAPTISAEGGNVTITSEYEGAQNFYKYGEADYAEGSSFTLSESATVTAMSKIKNGDYATFETASTSKDVYVLNPITEEKIITVSGTAVVDEEATATSTTGTIYKIEDGAITADKMDFFVKNLEFGAIANASTAAQYQVPAGQEAYIKMNATNISFMVAQGETADVHVICSKNACKNIDAEEAKDRQCKVNVDGTTYGCDDMLTGTYDITDADGNVVETLPTNEIKFSLGEGIHTFQKFSGTGNILISSIKITPVKGTGINAVNGENKVAQNGKFIKNNRVVIVKNGAEFSVTGAQLK
ncbi:MAG: chitobiase/beta-hexosaminidase C-terminal domain-containing protein [Prevotella sp.]|nr:chitobiase/beta-hexosaminidase C-terminal domain-containing protein [Prevotella sp.]